MKKAFGFALMGALVVALVPLAVNVDHSDPDRRKTSVKSVLYSVNVTTVPAGNGIADKTSVYVTVPGLIGEWIDQCRGVFHTVPNGMVKEIADKIRRSEDVTLQQEDGEVGK